MARKQNTKRLILNSLCLLISGFALGWLVGLSVSPVIQIILTSLVAVIVSISSALAGIRRPDDDAQQGPPENDEPNGRQSRKGRRSFAILLDPLPVTAMVLGLAVGASMGIYARANGWLAARNNIYVAEWKETGLSPKAITLRVFNTLYPPPGPYPPEAEESSDTNQDSALVEPASISASTPVAKGNDNPVTSKRAAESLSGAERQSGFRDGVLFATRLEQCLRLKNAETEDELKREMASSNFDELVRAQRSCGNYQCLRDAVMKACAKYKK